MKYFTNCETLEELRKEYKRLVKENHPDNGGSEDAIKVINVEYETALNNLKMQMKTKMLGNMTRKKTSFSVMH